MKGEHRVTGEEEGNEEWGYEKDKKPKKKLILLTQWISNNFPKIW